MKNGEYNLVVAPSDYPGKLYRGKYCYEHYLVYWKEYGIIPDKEQIIHHKNGDKRNNNINNLILMNRVKHIVFHDQQKQKQMVLLKCPVCGKEFSREKRQTHLNKPYNVTYCSRSCMGKAISLRMKQDINYINNLKTNVVKEYLV